MAGVDEASRREGHAEQERAREAVTAVLARIVVSAPCASLHMIARCRCARELCTCESVRLTVAVPVDLDTVCDRLAGPGGEGAWARGRGRRRRLSPGRRGDPSAGRGRGLADRAGEEAVDVS